MEAAYRQIVERLGPNVTSNPMFAQLHANAAAAYEMLKDVAPLAASMEAARVPAFDHPAGFWWTGHTRASWCFLPLATLLGVLHRISPPNSGPAIPGRGGAPLFLIFFVLFSFLCPLLFAASGYFLPLPPEVKRRARPLLPRLLAPRFLIVAATEAFVLWRLTLFVEFGAVYAHAEMRCLWPAVLAVAAAWALTLWQEARLSYLSNLAGGELDGRGALSEAFSFSPTVQRARRRRYSYLAWAMYFAFIYGALLDDIYRSYFRAVGRHQGILSFTSLAFISLFLVAAGLMKRWGILE